MPVFEYRGLNKAGKNIRGTVDSENLRGARVKLKKDGIFVVDLKAKGSDEKKAGKNRSRGSTKSVGVEDISMMTRQMATLIKSNIPLVEALGAVSDQVENPTLRETMSQLRDMVNEGGTLHKSLEKYPNVFSKIYISMVEAGEASGNLDIILLRLAEFSEAQDELTKKVKAAMIYPALMLFFTLGMLVVLFIFVIPKITEIFEQSDMQLPWYSKLVIDFSGFLVNWWHVLGISGVLLFMLFQQWKRTPKGSQQWDTIILKIPKVGKLARMVAVSRFTRTLSTLLAGGVPMLFAMDIVKNVVNNYVLEKAISEARDNISEGESVAVPLKKSNQFPPIVIHMISIGEKTGEIEQMLTQVSDSYDFQVKTSIQGLTSVLEPIMIVVMGCVVGIVIFAIMVPIFEMSQMAGK